MEQKGVRGRWPSARSEPLEHILAHDIANYLNIIQGQTELLLVTVEDADIADRLRIIRGQTIAANAMLQTIGGVARGGAQNEFAGVNVVDLLSGEADRLRLAYPEATITTDIDDGVRVRADELLLSVFTNLIENAITHNDSLDPHVHVTATVVEQKAIISVEDDGPGLPGDVQDQLEGKRLAHPQSGVHIVRFLVNKYEGSISVATCDDGTKISIELPIVQE